MGATEEQIAMLSANHVTHVSYILLLYSIAFLLFLFVSMLLTLYANSAWPLSSNSNATNGGTALQKVDAENGVLGNGQLGRDDRRVRDAEEFELEGLMSEDEMDETSEGSGGGRKESQRV